ncbi:hypothetical protein [Halorubrum xinjiangense]|uniref:hypothetical protein n=1 Tax=Halorubrum xinjiangense TaxID=261291 RepID=UPI00166006CE|nr:hypothetical protein [Halorubrum xinjiangense]
MPSKTRRSILALLGGGVALGLTGGAVAYAQPATTPLVIVNNQTGSDRVVTTVIRTAENDEVLVDDTRRIPASDEQGYTDLVADEPLLITVRTDNGLEETYRWTATDPENGLGIGIATDGIGFEVATPP